MELENIGLRLPRAVCGLLVAVDFFPICVNLLAKHDLCERVAIHFFLVPFIKNLQPLPVTLTQMLERTLNIFPVCGRDNRPCLAPPDCTIVVQF